MRPSQAQVTAVIAQAERWVLRVGVFLLPLAHTWDTYDGYVLPKLLLARAVVVALALLLLVRAMTAGRLAIHRTPLDWPLAAFLASAALSSVFAYNQNVAVFGTYARYDGLLTLLTYAALFWLAIQVIGDDRGEARTVLRVLLASGYAAALIAIGQVAHDSLTQGTFVAAYGTLGQKNVLGGFLAMLLPLAAYELVQAKSWTAALLSGNALIAMTVALVLTFSRSAWIGAAVGAVVLAMWIARSARSRAAILRLGVAAVVTTAAGVLIVTSLTAAVGQASPRADLASAGDRPAVWVDSLKVIASRPLLGYGPDNFGLVFPTFQSERLQQPWDKAHAETLQIAATQGVIGVAAYAAMLIGFAVAFWRGRSRDGSFAVLAAIVAYQVSLQVNFTALASAFPYWVVAACALVTWGEARESCVIVIERRLRAAPLVLAGAGAAAFVVTAGVAFPYLADRHLLTAVVADFSGHGASAVADATNASALVPSESVYAVEVGNLAFERGDWRSAAAAYSDAVRLGTYNPMVYRNLAIADRNLGLVDDARVAAREAVQLDRFDPANRALLAQFDKPQV